jgi:uncharacterized protein YmfQ (DUF2313 family)
MDADQFAESLAGLLPTGHAWPRDPGSVLMAVIRSEAAELAQHTADVHAAVRQWQPHTTVARLAEWEASCGLPDTCMGPNQTEAQRRQVLLRVLRGPELPESDSSAAAPAVIQTAAAELGFDVDVHYNTPLRVGLARAGSRLGALNGVLHVVVNAASSPLRAGLARVGDRLVNRTLPEADLACHLERLVPARFSINIVYD